MTMSVGGATPKDLLAGLIAQMRFLSIVARHFDKDLGRPTVPTFGREMHYREHL